MKKKYKNIIYALIMLLILVFINLMLVGKDVFNVIFSFSIFLMFVNSFSHINIEKSISEFKKNNYINSQVKLFYLTIGTIFMINIIYIGIIYVITLILDNNNYLLNYNYVMLFMGSSIFVIPTLNVLCQYLKANNLKKFSYVLKLLFYFIWGFLLIILLIINYKFNISSYIFAIYIYLLQILSFIITIICCLIVVKNKNIFKFKHIKKREENKINVKKNLKKIFSNSINLSIKKIIFLSYYYISVISVYYILLYKYSYGYKETIHIITDTYFYNFSLIIVLIIFYMLTYKVEFLEIVNKINDKKYNNCGIDHLFINMIKNTIPITILMCILSGPLLKLFFNSNNSIVFMFFVWTFPFILLYIVGIKLIEICGNKKILYTTLLFGILIKILLTIPLINCFYRMGYNLIYGDILSTIIGMFISYIIVIIYFNKKYNVNFANSFEQILNVVYDNIVLLLILIISSMIISLNVSTKIQALMVILIYIFIYVFYNFIKKIVGRYKERKI